MKKPTSTILILLSLIILGTNCLEPVCAQSTKPSEPKFSIQFPNDSSIQIVIENQAFTSSSSVNSIVYYYRVKDHNSYQWIRMGDYQLQSDSQTTLITIPPYPCDLRDYLFRPSMNNPLNNSTLLDFQVQAITGYYAITQKPGYMPGIPPVGPGDGYTEITFNDTESSDWSNPITVNIVDKITLSPSQISSLNPTPGPTSFQFNVSVEDKTYPVIADSNSTVTDLTFNPATKELNFKANGQTGTTGYCRITIPATLVEGELSIYKDETLLVKDADYTQSNDGTNNILQINYSHSTHNFKIVGTQAIPELPILGILPLFVIMSLITTKVLRRRM